jgi:hypothetical protein
VLAAIPSKRDPDWILVDGTQLVPHANLWAAWLVLQRGRWVVYHLGARDSAFQPARSEPIPCDIRPAFTEKSCLPVAPNAAAYATALYDAWRQDERPVATVYTTEAAVASLFARAWRPDDGWRFIGCRGAAGTSYCSWENDDTRLTLAVLDELAAEGAHDAVVEARFS